MRGTFCCARSLRVRRPQATDQQLQSHARAVEAGSHGSTSHSTSESLPTEEFLTLERVYLLGLCYSKSLDDGDVSFFVIPLVIPCRLSLFPDCRGLLFTF